MAIGREADPRRLPILVPLLKDDSPIVRRFALEALLRLETPEIKGPLLEVLGTWEEIKPPLSFGGDRVLGLVRLGLPNWLVDSNTSLAARQQWLEEFDSDTWRITFPVPHHDLTWDDGRTTIWATVTEAEFDSVDQFPLRLCIRRRGGKKATRALLPETGALREIQFNDSVPLTLAPKLDPMAENLDVRLPPDGNVEYDVLAKVSRGTLLPGVYLLEAGQADWPLLIRVRRSLKTEREIPELLSNAADSKSIKRLGDERVQAAVPVLLGGFTANANQNNFQAAAALARIGDPRAVPLMLQFPGMIARDVLGDTSSSLRWFGTTGDTEYARYILDWKAQLESDTAQSLRLSLQLLGTRGTAEVDQARLDLVRALAQSITNEQTRGNYGRLGIFQAAIPAVAQKHPEELRDALWTLRDRPEAIEFLMNDFRRERNEWSAKLVGQLFERAVEQSDYRMRKVLLRAALRQTPEIVLLSKSPLTTVDEARSLILGANATPSTLENTIARIEKYLQDDPHLGLKLGLAHLYDLRADSAKAEPLWREVLESESAATDEKATAHCSLGEVLSRRGEPAAAKHHFEAALLLMKPNTGYGWNSRTPADVRRRMDELAAIPELKGVTVTQRRMPSRIELNGDAELADRCAFFLDESRRLRRWDLRAQTENSFGVMPNPVRQFVPLDRSLVLVLYKDGSSWMYREGERKPVWEGPRGIPHWSHLSLSKDVITIADDSGALHALNPQDGSTLWKGRCHVLNEADPKPVDALPGAADDDPFAGSFEVTITGFKDPTSCRFVHQLGSLLLVPEKAINPRRFRCLRLKDGSEQSKFEVGFNVISLAADGDVAILAGVQGQIAAVSLSAGNVRWESKIDELNIKSDYELNTAWKAGSNAAYLTAKDRLWAIDPLTGRVLWSWTWSPAGKQPMKAAQYGPYSRMIPLDDHIVWLVDWKTGLKPVDGRDDRTDIVVLSASGQPLMHHTSPLSDSQRSVVAPYAVVDGETLFVRFDQTWESWPLPASKP